MPTDPSVKFQHKHHSKLLNTKLTKQAGRVNDIDSTNTSYRALYRNWNVAADNKHEYPTFWSGIKQYCKNCEDAGTTSYKDRIFKEVTVMVDY